MGESGDDWVTNDTADITGLTPGTTYHYRVDMVSQSGYKAYSDGGTFTTASQ